MVNSNRDLVLVRNLRWLNKEKYSFSVHFIHFFPSALFLFSKNRIRSASGGLEMLIWSEASNQGDIYENEGTWRPCMRGRRRKGRGRGGVSKAPIPLPLSLYLFLPTPYPFRHLLRRPKGRTNMKTSPVPPPLSVYSRRPLSSIWKPERNVLTVLMQSNLFFSLLSTSSLTLIVKLLIEPFHWRTEKSKKKKKNYQICDYICKVNLLRVKI